MKSDRYKRIGATRQISEYRLKTVLSQYPIGKLISIQAIESSKRNDNFTVEDSTGCRYVLRRFRRNNQEARIRFQLAFQQHLLDSGFPTPGIVKTVTGDMLVYMDNHYWTVFEFVEGNEFNQSIEQIAEAGWRLAQFHNVVDSFAQQEVVVGFNRMPDWWTRGDEELSELQKFFAGIDIEKELDCIKKCVTQFTRQWPAEKNKSLRQTWEHGDYHGRNMVFVGNEMRALFDFDVVHRGPRIEDIGRALFVFGCERPGLSNIRPEIARLFLDNYLRHAELSQEELEGIPILAVLDSIPFASYYAMLQRDGEDALAYFRNHVEMMSAMRTEMQRISTIFAQR
jgi:Ser/Thr protein kinase RdoA (MazF antagonist)